MRFGKAAVDVADVFISLIILVVVVFGCWAIQESVLQDVVGYDAMDSGNDTYPDPDFPLRGDPNGD